MRAHLTFPIFGVCSAIILNNTPDPLHVGDRPGISWQTQEGDPSSIDLWLHHPTVRSDFLLANTVDVGQGIVVVEVPTVPAYVQERLSYRTHF